MSVRPALTFSSISDITSNVVRGNDCFEVNFGTYPQYAVDASKQASLNRMLSTNLLKLTGREKTFDSVKYDNRSTGFTKRTYKEYEYNGERYYLMDVNSCYDGEEITLSNGLKCKDGDKIWVKDDPIVWIVNPKNNIAISKIALFAGVQFNEVSNYRNENDFKYTNLGKYLDGIFSKEIVSDFSYDNNQVADIEEKNPYEFDFKNVSEEEIIKGAIYSDIPVFLHGLSGDGKSARVKQIDNDYTCIDLGTSTLEGLIGLIAIDQSDGSAKYIEPHWYKELCDKCKKDPDKVHILFLDELTNAPLTIQKCAYGISLEKVLINSGFKLILPENSRVVAAGNETKDSSAAVEMAEPLFNRFAHVYIKTNKDKWLNWAHKNNIHPSIVAYISCMGDSALRSEYTGESPNADPRKWEMASKMLYKTNNPEMLRALVGADITLEFCKFCKEKIITIKDVLENNYTKEDLQMDAIKQNATVLCLSYVDEEYIYEIRKFIVDNFDKDYIKLFDMWFIEHGDESRVLLIDELNKSQSNEKGVSL